MVKVFQTFASNRQLLKLSRNLIIGQAKDYYPRPADKDYQRRNDAPWVRRFSAAGGNVVISGNTKMKSVPHERLALVEEGVVVIFFESRWNNWPFFSKCSLLLHWWPVVIKQLKTAKPGSFWHIPATWPEPGKGKLRSVPNDDLKMVKIERQKADGDKIRTARARKRRQVGDDQGDLINLINKATRSDAEKKRADEAEEASGNQ